MKRGLKGKEGLGNRHMYICININLYFVTAKKAKSAA